jgi:copper transport protein
MAWAALVFGAVMQAVLLGVQSPAQAHAVLTRSTPAASSVVQEPPREVVLTFSENVRPVNDKIRVIGPDGKRADTGKIGASGAVVRIPLKENPAKGTYLVSYRVISADSHPVPGGFTFSYGQPSAPPSEIPSSQVENTPAANAMKVAKYLGYAGLVLLVGSVVVLTLLWPARLDRRGPRRVMWAGFGLTALGTVLGLAFQVPYTGATFSEVMESQYGVAMLVRLAALAIGVIMVRPLIKGGGGQTDRVLVLILAAIAAITWPIAGHPAATPVPPISIISDALHLGAVSLWLGGLLMLVLFLLRQADERELGAILPVWSRWAGMAVSVVLLAGVVSALIEIGTPNALVHTTYGRLVILKVGLVGLILATAAFARRGVQRAEGRRIRKFVAVEVSIAAVVLGVTAVLTQTTPARTAEALSIAEQNTIFDSTIAGQLFKLQVQVDPARKGDNLIHVWAYTLDGQPLNVLEWKVTAGLPAAGIEPVDVPTLKLTDNHITGSVALPQTGDWQLEITCRVSEIDQDTVTATVPVK